MAIEPSYKIVFFEQEEEEEEEKYEGEAQENK